MHRIQAGDFSKGKSIEAVSTRGYFSVEMPIPFNDFTVEPMDGGAVERIFVIGGKKDDFKLSAMRFEYRDGAASARKYFEQFCTNDQFSTAVKNCRRLALDGREVIEFSTQGASSWSMQRVVKLENELVILSVEAPIELQSIAAVMAHEFLESLKILRP